MMIARRTPSDQWVEGACMWIMWRRNCLHRIWIFRVTMRSLPSAIAYLSPRHRHPRHLQ